MYDASLVYPERKRCARCRSYFCWMVVFGLFCSRECAQIPPISSDPQDWPRHHYAIRPDSGDRKEKRVFPSVNSARRFLKRNRIQGKEIYRCAYCWELHIGSPDPEKVYRPHPVMAL